MPIKLLARLQQFVVLGVLAVHISGIAFAGGCATTGLPRCPERGGPTWRAVASEHFVVYTDGSTRVASELLGDLELVRAALAQFLLPGWDGPEGQIPVVALQGEGHFDEFFARGVHGVYTELFLQPTIVLAGRRGLSQTVLVKHELAHYLVDAFIPSARLPRWVAEGLATFTETMDIDRDGGRVTFGKTVDDRVIFALARYYPLRVSSQWKTDLMLTGESAFYGQSWLKVHYLINEHGAAFASFLGALRRGVSEDDAWSAAFPDLPQAQLDARLTEYARGGRYALMTMRVPAGELAIDEQPVDDADVHGWRAILYALRNRMREDGDATAVERGRREIAEARRQDPGNVRALGAQLLFGDTITVAQATQATTRHPDDWLAWYLLSEAHAGADDDDARWAAVKEALRRSRSNPAVRLMDTLQGRREPRREHGTPPGTRR